VSQALGHFEGSMGAVVLRRCPGCHAPHPGEGMLLCPHCGTELELPSHFCAAPAVVGAPAPTPVEAGLLWVGVQLKNLADKI
jgi:uncharacterized membrane protein